MRTLPTSWLRTFNAEAEAQKLTDAQLTTTVYLPTDSSESGKLQRLTQRNARDQAALPRIVG